MIFMSIDIGVVLLFSFFVVRLIFFLSLLKSEVVDFKILLLRDTAVTPS